MRLDERNTGEYTLRGSIVFGEYLLWLLLDPSKFKSFDKKKIKRVLLMHHGAIGEVIMMTSLLPSIKKALNCHVTCMVKPGMEDILKNNPFVDHIIPYKGSFEEKLSELKKHSFDLAIVTQSSFENGRLCLQAGIPFRIGGFCRIGRFPCWPYTRRINPWGLKHSLERNLDLIRAIGIKPFHAKPALYLTKKERAHARSLASSAGTSNFAILHPGFGPKGSKSPPREWPPRHYADIARFLIDEYGLSVMLTGSKDQRDLVEDIKKSIKRTNVINLAGETSLREAFALIEQAELVIAPDTGMSHAAAALGTPLVNLMDAPIEEWGPIGNSKKIVNIRNPREIVFFEKGKLFQKTGGVKTITVDQVKKAVKTLLD